MTGSAGGVEAVVVVCGRALALLVGGIEDPPSRPLTGRTQPGGVVSAGLARHLASLHAELPRDYVARPAIAEHGGSIEESAERGIAGEAGSSVVAGQASVVARLAIHTLFVVVVIPNHAIAPRCHVIHDPERGTGPARRAILPAHACVALS